MTTSPSAIPLATRFAALIPIRHFPRITAILVRHVWPLIVTVIGGRAPARMASTALFGISTPVALPAGMTLALNFMFASPARLGPTPTVLRVIPAPACRWSDRWLPSALGRRTPCRRRETRDGRARPSTADRRTFACQFRAAPDRQVPRVDHQAPRVRSRG